jgi:SAM-dependent methyltransferase
MGDPQIEYWSGPAALRWVNHQAALDRSLASFGRAALARAAARPGEHVLDVGCGCGDSSLALAQQVAPHGSVTGVDVSAGMLERARERAAGSPLLQFVLADAASFTPPTRFELVFSRFGVMFFSEPERAFAHLRALLCAAGRIVFVCWRALGENPWAQVPLETIQRTLPELPPLGLDEGPGPFAFADRDRLASLLGGAGFQQITIERCDAGVLLGGELDEAVQFAMNGGPAARLLGGVAGEALERARVALSKALASCRGAQGYTLPGATWLVEARAR